MKWTTAAVVGSTAPLEQRVNCDEHSVSASPLTNIILRVVAALVGATTMYRGLQMALLDRREVQVTQSLAVIGWHHLVSHMTNFGLACVKEYGHKSRKCP